MSSPTSVETQKAQLRGAALARRDDIPTAERVAAAELIANRPFPLNLPRGAVVSGFAPMRSEINPLPLMRRLADANVALALPVVVGRGHALIFRAWTFGDPMGKGVWGIREPLPQAREVLPDALIVPLAAFDRGGGRLGYGGGYYDLTLTQLRTVKSIVAVGIAFAAQEMAAVPVTSRDARLDWVITEREVIDCREVRG